MHSTKLYFLDCCVYTCVLSVAFNPSSLKLPNTLAIHNLDWFQGKVLWMYTAIVGKAVFFFIWFVSHGTRMDATKVWEVCSAHYKKIPKPVLVWWHKLSQKVELGLTLHSGIHNNPFPLILQQLSLRHYFAMH